MRSDTLYLFVIFYVVYIAESRRPFTFIFENTTCLANPKYISVFKCEVKAQQMISMDILLAKDASRLTYDLQIALPQTQQNRILINITKADGCAFLANSYSFPLVKIVREMFDKYSNLPKKCPVKNGTSIQVRNLKVDPESFPNYIPETAFIVLVRMYEGDEHLFNLTINGTCKQNRRQIFMMRG